MANRAKPRHDQVTRVDDLVRLSLMRRSVICPATRGFNKPLPAAWMVNLSGRILAQLFSVGMYVYEKKPKAAKRSGRKS